MHRKEDLQKKNSYPIWFGGNKCYNCDTQIPTENFQEIGFITQTANKKNRGKMFVRYHCKKCGIKDGIIYFGSKDTDILKLCVTVVEQSNFMTECEKIQWKRKNVEKNTND